MKPRRIYYVPGMISLMLLPVSIILFLQYKDIAHQYYALQINWSYNGPKEFKEHYISNLENKKYTHIRMGEDKTNNAIRLNFAQLEIRDLFGRSDSVHGINFHFEDQTPYETFVRVIEMLTTEKIQTYYGNGSDIWVFNYTVPPLAESQGPYSPITYQFVCGTRNTQISETSNLDQGIEYLKSTPPRFLISLVLFVLLILVNARKLLR